jgi:thymidine kinase
MITNMPKGMLILITGCMFSGKTTRLIHFANKALDDGKKIEIYYPEIDTRYGENHITSHDGVKLLSKALPVNISAIPYVGEQVIFIDELHFFGNGMVAAIDELQQKGVDLIVSGLDTDYRNKPFGIMPAVMHLADEIIQLKAKCTICGNDATYTFRKDAKKDDETIVVGGTDLYEARCEEHYVNPE